MAAFTAPALPAPRFFIFRGFLSESACGLVSPDALKNQLYHANASIPVRLRASAGMVRAADYKVSGLQVIMGTRPAHTEAGEQPGTVNGLIQGVRVPVDAFPGLHAGFFDLVSRPVSDFECLTWLKIPDTVAEIYVQSCPPNRYQPATLRWPLLQTYLDQQIARARNVGERFALEWVDSSRNWPKFWLNDRKVGRRPWVHVEKSKPTGSGGEQVSFNDSLLRNYPAAPHNQFAHRALPSEYSIVIARERRQVKSAGGRDQHKQIAPTQNSGRDWSGVMLPSHKTKHFLFGFGSLMNTKSRTSSDPTAISVVPMRVAAGAGFARAWNFQHPTCKITALGVQKCAKGEGRSINGVCTPIMAGEEEEAGGGGNGASGDGGTPRLPQAVLDREVGYTPFPIPSELLEPLSWAELPAGSTVWLFVPNSQVAGGKPGTGLDFASSHHPILQTYVDICILGCLEFSREFAIEFICSTIGWDGPWLNDREVPRRPWVFCPAYNEIDGLLEEVIPEHFQKRMLPEEFGAWLIEQDSAQKETKLDASASQTLSARGRMNSVQMSSEIHY
jgi:hypothetical protein